MRYMDRLILSLFTEDTIATRYFFNHGEPLGRASPGGRLAPPRRTGNGIAIIIPIRISSGIQGFLEGAASQPVGTARCEGRRLRQGRHGRDGSGGYVPGDFIDGTFSVRKPRLGYEDVSR